MQQQIVFTLSAQDTPGIVTTISTVVSEHGGNWLDSRMSQLAGEFVGIVHVGVDLDKKSSLETALLALSDKGITVEIRQSAAQTNTKHAGLRLHQIQLIGQDRPGIVTELSRLFSSRQINIFELDTQISDASMAGGVLFNADAVVGVDKSIDLDELLDHLHELADALSLDIEWTAHI